MWNNFFKIFPTDFWVCIPSQISVSFQNRSTTFFLSQTCRNPIIMECFHTNLRLFQRNYFYFSSNYCFFFLTHSVYSNTVLTNFQFVLPNISVLLFATYLPWNLWLFHHTFPTIFRQMLTFLLTINQLYYSGILQILLTGLQFFFLANLDFFPYWTASLFPLKFWRFYLHGCLFFLANIGFFFFKQGWNFFVIHF